MCQNNLSYYIIVNCIYLLLIVFVYNSFDKYKLFTAKHQKSSQWVKISMFSTHFITKVSEKFALNLQHIRSSKNCIINFSSLIICICIISNRIQRHNI